MNKRAEGRTRKESRVLEEAARGETNKEIAQALGVSVPTVAFHLGKAFRKLGVGTRQEAARKYLQLFATK